MTTQSAIVAGVGPPRGLGAAVARRFAREGFRIVILGRTAEKLDASANDLRARGAAVEAVVADVTDEDAVRSAVARADASDAPLAAAVFNAGGNWPKRFLDMDRGFLEEMWRVNALAGFFFAKAAVSAMLPRGAGTLIFTGASGSLRGRAGFAGFAQAKAALRALAQSGAREFGPKGIHVAHVVVDGAIDGDRIHQFLPNLKEERGQDGLLDPDAIAENYWHLHAQARSAWTHELDVRPWVESW
ncbi:MAG TPA: SDR family NAD(P)-dependent oxidoreductase [Candidatus Binatia bacterium]|nr:SDR family NAD(P)-dependent oxidoreductase [Candidatus Binatia bacterium]